MDADQYNRIMELIEELPEHFVTENAVTVYANDAEIRGHISYHEGVYHAWTTYTSRWGEIMRVPLKMDVDLKKAIRAMEKLAAKLEASGNHTGTLGVIDSDEIIAHFDEVLDLVEPSTMGRSFV